MANLFSIDNGKITYNKVSSNELNSITNKKKKLEELKNSYKNANQIVNNDIQKIGNYLNRNGQNVNKNNPFQANVVSNAMININKKNLNGRVTLQDVVQDHSNLLNSEKGQELKNNLRISKNERAWSEYNYNQEKVNNEDTTLADKTIGTVTRGVKDLFSNMTDSRDIVDDKGKTTRLPSYNELKQNKVSQDYKTGIGKFLGDASYNISKIGASTLMNIPTLGVGGSAIYWSDMYFDSYNSAKNQGYSEDKAFSYALANTGFEYIVGKFLGSATKGLTGGQTSELSNAISNGVNKLISNPKVASIIGNAGSEATEEFIQEYLDNINKLVTLNGSKNPKDYIDVLLSKDILKDAFYSAGVGAVSGGLLQGINNKEGKYAQYNTNLLKSFKNQLEISKSNLTDKETIAKYDSVINDINDYISKPFGNESKVEKTLPTVYDIVAQEKNSATVLHENNPGLNTSKTDSGTSSLKPMLNEPTKLIHDNTTLHHTSETANSNTSNTLIGNNIAQSNNGVNFNKNRFQENNNYFPTINTNTQSIGKYNIKNLNNHNEVILKVIDFLKNSYLSTENQSKPIKNIATGMEIEIRQSGIRETFGNPKYYDKLSFEMKKAKISTMEHLAKMIKYGVVRSQEAPNYHNKNSKVTYAYLKHPINIDGKNYLVNIDIRKSPKGENRFYIHSLELKKETDLSSPQSELLMDKSISYDNNIPQINNNVKLPIVSNNDMQNNENNTNKINLPTEKNTLGYIPQDPTRESSYNDANIEKIAKILDQKPINEDQKQNRIKELLTTKILDKGYYIDKIARQYKNPELSSKYDYQMLANGIGNQIIGNGRYDNKGNKIGKSLYEIFEPIENAGLVQEFSEYMYHQHNIDRMNLDGNILKNGEIEKNKPVFGESVTAEISKNKVEDLLEKYPQFEKWANEVYKYSQDDFQMLVDNQVISEQEKEYYNKKYPHYVPIVRAKDSVKINMETYGKKATVRTPIKAAQGGNADLIPLKDALAYRTMQSTKSALINDFGLELYKTINGDKFSGIEENIDTILDDNKDASETLTPPTKNSNATFSVYKNGEKIVMNITDEIYEALTPRNLVNINGLNKFNNFRRGILTEYNPIFMITNPIKDIQDGLINSKRPLKFIKNIPEAFMQIKNKGEMYQLYIANGGGQDTYFNYDKGTNLTKTTNSKLPSSVNNVLEKINIPKKVLNKISSLNQFIEMTPRLSEFISSIDSGDTIQTAMYNSQEVTTNFKRGGDWTKNLDRNGFTFLNAGVQGFQKQIRNVQEARMNGIRGYASLGVKFAVNGLALGLLNGLIWGDDDDYEDLSDYIKNNYYIIGKYGSGKFLRIPKGRVTSVLQKIFNNLIDVSQGKDYDYEGLKDLIKNNLLPNNPEENNLISPLIQAMNNETWYGGELVPTRLQNLPNKEQYDETTDSISIWLGNKLNISPYKINYLLDQYSGAIGDFLLPYLTLQAESSSDSFGGQLLAPLKDKFTTDSVLKNQNVSDIYSLSEEYTKKSNSTNATSEDKLINKYINSTKSDMSELYAEKRNIQSDKNLSNKEKYTKAREIQKKIDKLAKDTLNTYKKVEVYSNYGKVNKQEYYLNSKKEWTKVKDDESIELSELNYTSKEKNEYFKTKVEIGTIRSNESLDSSVKHERINQLLINSSMNDEMKGHLYGKYYSSESKINAIIKAGINFNEFLKFNSQEFTTDYYSNGKAVPNSRKNKVIKYVNSLNLSIPQKALLIKMEYSSYKKYDKQIAEYVNSMNISFLDKASILKKAGFTSYDKQIINYVNKMNITKTEKEEILEEMGFTIRNGRVYS